MWAVSLRVYVRRPGWSGVAPLRVRREQHERERWLSGGSRTYRKQYQMALAFYLKLGRNIWILGAQAGAS